MRRRASTRVTWVKRRVLNRDGAWQFSVVQCGFCERTWTWGPGAPVKLGPERCSCRSRTAYLPGGERARLTR